MAPHLGLEKIAWKGLAKKQKLPVIVQHMIKNLSKNYGPVFPYFWEIFFQSLEKILNNNFIFQFSIFILQQ
jgi:hypothetical protein